MDNLTVSTTSILSRIRILITRARFTYKPIKSRSPVLEREKSQSSQTKDFWKNRTWEPMQYR